MLFIAKFAVKSIQLFFYKYSTNAVLDLDVWYL